MNKAFQLKNIIFDLGGVILNIDSRLTVEAFKQLGLSDFEIKFSSAKQTTIFDDLETGKISPDEFYSFIRKRAGVYLPDSAIEKAWNAMLLDLPEERLDLLEKLKKNYRTFLLSNTNKIHIRAFSVYLQKRFGVKNLSHLFEKEYYSYQIKLRKPDKAVFTYVLNENNLAPEETLFIDDSLQHINSAMSAGIHAIHLTPPKTILDLGLV